MIDLQTCPKCGEDKPAGISVCHNCLNSESPASSFFDAKSSETVNCPYCDYHLATATQFDDFRNITCSNCGLDKDVAVKSFPKLSDTEVSTIRAELSAKSGDNS